MSFFTWSEEGWGKFSVFMVIFFWWPGLLSSWFDVFGNGFSRLVFAPPQLTAGKTVERLA